MPYENFFHLKSPFCKKRKTFHHKKSQCYQSSGLYTFWQASNPYFYWSIFKGIYILKKGISFSVNKPFQNKFSENLG